MELVGGLILFFLAGIFGWGSTPACFVVISRLLLYEMRIMDNQCVSIASMNVLRAVYGFSSVGENGLSISVSDVERLASWTSRYGVSMPQLTSTLHAA